MEFTFEAEKEQYTFKQSKIRGIYEDFSDPEYFNKQVLVLGKMMTLFGEPLYLSQNLEKQYEYSIKAKAKTGENICLTVYSGETGPSIRGAMDRKSREAAEALSQYICNAKPSDYHYEGYCMDGPYMVYEGVKDGVPYRMEKELDLYDEEFTALYERLYGIKKEI